jgi:hypothetical protein
MGEEMSLMIYISLLDMLSLYHRRPRITSGSLSRNVTIIFLDLIDVLARMSPAETLARAGITPVAGSHRIVGAFAAYDSPSSL